MEGEEFRKGRQFVGFKYGLVKGLLRQHGVGRGSGVRSVRPCALDHRVNGGCRSAGRRCFT